MTELNSNRFYRVKVYGYAKEIQNGKEVDPVNYDEQKKKYVNKPWSQSKYYYFRTGSAPSIPDCPELQDYVAIAYPSYYNQLKYTDGSFAVHEHDLRYPTIALTTNLKDKAFKKGNLYWRLYQGSKLISEDGHRWVTTDNTCNMTVANGLKNIKLNTTYTLKLVYETSKTVSGKVTTTTTELANMKVWTNGSSWITGKDKYMLQYEKPFCGTRLNNVSFKYDVYQNMKTNKVSDYEVSRNNKMLDYDTYRAYDPYLYIAYLGDYGFFGGWEFTADRIDINVTTAQSVIYNDKGGVYEGKLGTGDQVYNIYNDYKKVRSLSVYDRDQWSKISEYPLPVMDDSKYSYVMGGTQRINSYYPSDDNYKKVRNTIIDLYRPYSLAASICKKVQSYALQIDNIDANNNKYEKEADLLDQWYQQRVGTYCTATYNDCSIMIPCYQFPILWGAAIKNSGSKKKITAWGALKGYADADKKHDQSRGHEGNAEWVYCGMIGSDKMKGDNVEKKNKHGWDCFYLNRTMLERMTNANFTVYRVNAYDYKNCQYTVNNSLWGPQFVSTFNIKQPLVELIYNDR